MDIKFETNIEKPIEASETVVPVTSTKTIAPEQTETITPTQTLIPTNTDKPDPTLIPGVQVYPLSLLGTRKPWLPLEEGKEPMSVFLGFNVEKPPFDNVLVRQAFAAAIDREKIAKEAESFKFREVTPATSFTPPKVLGRDLYNEVGIPFDSARAKELLQQAGYADVANFPSVTLIVSTRGREAPEAYSRLGQTIVNMWESHLGIRVELQVIDNWRDYLNRLETNLPSMYQMGWGADYNDPDNFLNFWFNSNSDFNYGHFSNQEFDRLVEEAATLNDPAKRHLLYIQAEQLLTEQEAGVIPLFHTLYYLQP